MNAFEGEAYKSSVLDLYMGVNFNNSKQIYETIVSEKIFDHVYRFDCGEGKVNYCSLFENMFKLATVSRYQLKVLNKLAKSYSRKIITKIFVIKRFLSIKQMAYGKEYPLSAPYDEIYASYYNPFVKNMLLFSPDATVSFFEDGSRAYVESIFDFCLTHEPDRKMSLAGVDFEKFRPQNSFVFRPDMCKINDGSAIKKITLYYGKDSNFNKKIERIFKYKKPKIYDGVQCIFLMCPEEDISILGGKGHGEDCVIRYKNAIRIIDQEIKNVIFRVHPRQRNCDYNNIKIDFTCAMWELLIPEIINDNTVLISLSSTGAMTPTIFYGIEPYNIMIDEYVFADMDGLSFQKEVEDCLINIYKRKDKVIHIDSEEDLISCIKTIIDE